MPLSPGCKSRQGQNWKEVFEVVENVEVGNKKVESEESGRKKKPVESVMIGTSNGLLSFSVWEGGSITVRVSKRKDNGDEYETVWMGRINPIDFIGQFGELKAIARIAQNEVKKVLGIEI